MKKILYRLRFKPQCPSNEIQMPHSKIVGTAVIGDYELLYKGSKTGSYLTIEKKKGSVVRLQSGK
ncbi:hypothetical protein [Ruminococcus sp.]|uniref:hypothetical protein n=1 Tax=Ruminococcus sp. TaxID=41978 RepID=UPI0039947EA3